MMIELVGLGKKFDNRWVIKDLNLTIPDNQMTCIIGRSGEGKSVLLKQVIGLIEPTEGKVLVDGVDTSALSGEAREENLKKFGYVFQFAALLDSLNVFQNVGITLLENGLKPKDVLPIVKEKLALVDLSEDVLEKYPAELSGGMRKRVGLARTLVTNPKIILYDEPTTGLDPITSGIVHRLMDSMQKKLGLTSVVITHDVKLFNYADNIALLYDGKIRFFGDAKTIWESDNPYVYQFIRGLEQGPIKTEIAHTTTRV